MIDKIKTLQDLGFSLSSIEKQAGLANGTLSKVLKSRKYRKTTERKVNEAYTAIIKGLVNKL